MQIAEAVARISKFAEGYNLVAAEALRGELDEIISITQRKYFRDGGRRGPGHIVSRSGRLRESFERAVVFRGDEIVGTIRSVGVDYAGFVFRGTRPHVIRARRAKYLRWFDEQGDIHFAKEVNHPGTDPRPAVEWAVKDRSPKVADTIARALVKEWQRRVG